ncbi:MAG: selenocysteine-specific translation elongation factor [Phycisphaerae bacterium]
MDATANLVVGTAGHIDHGKSRLVLALTGSDPDRLPEEKARGMTIDLGFAHARIDGCDISFVDVPGHERFIRNMLAGASGIDLALLVVAADDSVMPQTREHAEVLALLGVKQCVVALTKMDLVDEEWADQVEEEVRGLLADLGLEAVGWARTSAEDGRGVEELGHLLAGLATERSRRRAPQTWFRMPIDRSFTVSGRGTVATGTVAHGSVAREDECVLWPGGQRVRVRDLQVHNDSREATFGRVRLAVNLAGIEQAGAGRGCTLSTPGYLQATRYLDVWLAWLRMPGKTRRQTLRLRLHMATSEVLTELRLLDKPDDQDIRGVFGQLKTAEPIVAVWNERFILRDESGRRTLGGGAVVRPVTRLWTARRPAYREGLEALLDGQPPARLEEVIRNAEWQPLDYQQLAMLAGLRDEAEAAELCQRLMGGGKIRLFEAASLRVHVHNAWLEALTDNLLVRLKAYMQDNPRLPGLPRPQWPAWMPSACPPRLRPVLAEHFLKSGPFILDLEHVRPAGERQKMSPGDQALFDSILQQIDAAAYQPPVLTELSCYRPGNEKRLRQLIDLAATQGRLERISSEYWLHERRWNELIDLVTSTIRKRGPLGLGDLRTLADSSRKFMVPIIEHMDKMGITRRVGDVRELGPNAQ